MGGWGIWARRCFRMAWGVRDGGGVGVGGGHEDVGDGHEWHHN